MTHRTEPDHPGAGPTIPTPPRDCPAGALPGAMGAGAGFETMWPDPVAVGAVVALGGRPYRVRAARPRRVACDDPLIFGEHVAGSEGALGTLVSLEPLLEGAADAGGGDAGTGDTGIGVAAPEPRPGATTG